MTTLNKKLSVTTLAMALLSTGIFADGSFERLPGSESPQMERFRKVPVASRAEVYRSLTENDLRYTNASDSSKRDREEHINRQNYSAQAEKARVSAEPGILGKIGQMVLNFVKSFFAR